MGNWVWLGRRMGVGAGQGRKSLKSVGEVMGCPWGLIPGYRSCPLEEKAAPGPLIQGKTYAQVQLILEIFIDHIKVTVILKSMRFLLEKKEKKKKKQ